MKRAPREPYPMTTAERMTLGRELQAARQALLGPLEDLCHDAEENRLPRPMVLRLIIAALMERALEFSHQTHTMQGKLMNMDNWIARRLPRSAREAARQRAELRKR